MWQCVTTLSHKIRPNKTTLSNEKIIEANNEFIKSKGKKYGTTIDRKAGSKA